MDKTVDRPCRDKCKSIFQMGYEKLADSQYGRAVRRSGQRVQYKSGAYRDRRRCRVCARHSESVQSKPLIAAGRTSILELASLIKRFKVYLTPDSAPMHIAASMGTPCIALFGPTDPQRHVVPSGACIVITRRAS